MRKLAPSIVVVLLIMVVSAVSANGQNFSPWSPAVLVGSDLNTSSDDGCPFISKNDLDLYFRSNRTGGQGGQDMYVSHRDSVDDPWDAPVNLGPEVNTSANETCSFVTIDGHWLYFVSNRTNPTACGNFDLWVSHRKDKRNDTGWETPVNLGCTAVDSASADHGPSILADEASGQTLLFFSSARSGSADIYVAQMVSEDRETFGPPSPVAELNSAANDLQPFVRRKDGLEVIFASDRTGEGALGGYDLWVSTRPTTADPWSMPVNLGPQVNSTAIEQRPSLSWDGTTLYFLSGRPGGAGLLDLYMATRTKLPD